MVKICSGCGAKNFDDAITCFNCDRNFEEKRLPILESRPTDFSQYDQKKKTPLPVIAGSIMIIIAIFSLIDLIIGISIITSLYGAPKGDIANIAILASVIRIVIVILLLITGYQALTRNRFDWALGGSLGLIILVLFQGSGSILQIIINVILLIIGIVVLLLLIQSRNEFKHPEIKLI
jgi:hypothetical protein